MSSTRLLHCCKHQLQQMDCRDLDQPAKQHADLHQRSTSQDWSCTSRNLWSHIACLQCHLHTRHAGMIWKSDTMCLLSSIGTFVHAYIDLMFKFNEAAPNSLIEPPRAKCNEAGTFSQVIGNCRYKSQVDLMFLCMMVWAMLDRRPQHMLTHAIVEKPI